MKKIFVLGIFLIIFFFFKPLKILGDHGCNQRCIPFRDGTSICADVLKCIRTIYGTICRNPQCPDDGDCVCDYANCKNLTGPQTLVLGNNYTFQATYENGSGGVVTKRGFTVYGSCSGTTFNNIQTDQASDGGEGIVSFNWTPTNPGTFRVICRAWSNITECRGDCNNGISGNPYACAGPNSSMTVTVITPTPYIVLRAKDPAGQSVQVAGMSFTYNCGASSICFTSPQSNISNYTSYAHGGVNGGGGIVLDNNQILIGVTPNPGGGSQNTRTNSCQPTSTWYNCAQWRNYWWSSSPNTGQSTIDFIIVTPTPTLYPTVAVAGYLKEYAGAVCNNDISSDFVSVNLIPQAPAGVTPVCGITPPTGQTKTSYRCNVIFNNQTANPTPVQNLTLQALALNYSSAYWTDGNSCSSISNNNISVNVASQPPNNIFNKDIFFNITNPWIKLRNSSFLSSNSLNNIIPQNISLYDSDDINERYFIIGSSPGVVAAESINLGTAKNSSKEWLLTDYSQNSFFISIDSFLEYVKSRKQYQKINNLSNLTEGKINLWQNNLTIDNTNQSNFDGKKIVLLVKGVLNINSQNFSPTNGVLAVIAESINFSSTTQSVSGIFIAPIINTGSTTNQGLKIIGNLITKNLQNLRKWQNNTRPSLFIVFRPDFYINLLPYLSIRKYEWKQLQ